MRAVACKSILFVMMTAVSVMVPKLVQAVDTLPGDFIAAPPGLSAVLFYGTYARSDGAVVSGQEVSGRLNSYVGLPRVAHYLDVFGLTMTVNVYLPIIALQGARLDSTSLSNVSGMGDLSVAGALWLLNDPKKTKYFAVAGYLNMPTGKYDAFSPLKLGSNRWSGSFQIGGIYGLASRWFIEGLTDVTLYGDNSNYDGKYGVLAQKPTVTGQLWLTFKATDRMNLSAGYGTYWGGKQTLNGTSLGFNSEKQQARAAVSAFVTPTFQILCQVSHDFMVDGGFNQEFASQIRVMQAF